MNELTVEWVAKAEAGYAVRFRYPGETADKTEAQKAYEIVTAVRAVLRVRLTSEG